LFFALFISLSAEMPLEIGGEFTLKSDLYIMSEFYHKNDTDTKENYFMSIAKQSFWDIHTIQIGMIYETENRVFIANPELKFSLSDAASLVLSAMFIDGSSENMLLSQMKDKIFFEINYVF